MRTRAGTVALAVLVSLAGAASASAASWGTLPPEAPVAESAPASLMSVSCVAAAGSCEAVGGSTSSAAGGLAEEFNGSDWTPQTLPGPLDAAGSELTGVACSSAVDCVAVGWVAAGPGGHEPSAARWDGSTWAQVPSTSPAGGQLNAVSCPSASACFAVGKQSAGVLVESLTSAGLTVLTVPTRAGERLASVSCPAANACMAVGGGRTGPVVLRWNGQRWARQAAPQPNASVCAHVKRSRKACNRFIKLVSRYPLSGVSCSGASDCTAIGAGAARCGVRGGCSATVGTLAELWNGSRWLDQRLPLSATAISCPNGTSCTAVGSVESGGDDPYQVPSSARWDGSRWSVGALPWSSDLSSTPLPVSISCVAASSCLTVGPATSARLAEGGWSAANPVPTSVRTSVSISSISCSSPSDCVGVGVVAAVAQIDYGPTATPVAELWNGSAWSPDPVTAATGQPLSVSCPTDAFCAAVGDGIVAVRVDGIWNAAQLPGIAQIRLQGVSCPSTTFCLAVGENGASAVVATWTGATWQFVPVSANKVQLTAVSCTSPTFCLVSAKNGDNSAAAFVWNGVPAPPAAVLAATAPPPTQLTSVSCVAADWCMAAGNPTCQTATPPCDYSSFWNGASWATDALPLPPAGKVSTSTFDPSVACVSTVSCELITTNVLDQSGSTSPSLLAFGWDGTSWTPQPVPSLPNSGALTWSTATLSCATSSGCLAIGLHYS